MNNPKEQLSKLNTDASATQYEKVLVTRSSMPSFEEYVNMIQPIWDSAWMTNNGTLCKQFQSELEEYLCAPELSLMVNGHMALEMSLQAMGLSGEVITTPFTFASTTHAIVRNGLTPVFCDIREDNYTIDVDLIEDLITPDTTAIVPVHVYGQLCDVNAIYQIAKKHNLKVIYDAAHTFGEKVAISQICDELKDTIPSKDGMINVSNFGDVSILSFHATKVFNSIEGGAAIFSDHSIGEKLYRLKNFGIMSEIEIDGVGANAKMNEFQAAMGLCNLKHIDAEIEKRKVRVKRYRDWFSKVDGIKLLKDQEGVVHNYAYFPIVVTEQFSKTRDEIYDELKLENIFSRKYFYPLTSGFQCYEGRFDQNKTPIAKKISEQVLVLPLYADLPLEIVDRICKIILGGKKGD